MVSIEEEQDMIATSDGGTGATRWTALAFGKHTGLTLPQIALLDPNWLVWAWRKRAFCAKGPVAEACEVYAKAQAIRVPGGKVVQYVLWPGTSRLGNINLVPPGTPCGEGSSCAFLSRVLDLTLPTRLAGGRDPIGDRIILSVVKHIVLAPTGGRLTKQVCEEFFSNAANFAPTNPAIASWR